ncbi:MAG: carbohydrate kinase family protein [Clostridiales bacterium]|jgi:sugar/nucleoside kinase (ribokinase family)|nr:carbohydrate kinase family protein [Clostridiales bacterium]
MYDVACIGILVADIIAKPVDAIPGKGLLGLVDGITLHSGGCAMSASVDMAKLGLKTALLGKVGGDGFGAFMKDTLARYHVNFDGLVTDARNQTSASVVLSDGAGERTFLHCAGANAAFGKEDVNWDVLRQSEIVFVAGTMLMDTFDGAHCAEVLKRCKELGKTTVLDTAWDSKGRWMSVLGQCMPYIDVFVPSIEEAARLSGKTEPKEIADVFFEKGVKRTAIKLGEKGCYLREDKDAAGVFLPPYRNVTVVDTTGAGDSFCAGFLTGLVKGMSFTDCGRFANAVGAHCVSATGATTGIRSFEETLKFMEEN